MPKSKGFRPDPSAEAHIGQALSEDFNLRVGPLLLNSMRAIVPIRSGALYRALTFEVIDGDPSDVVLRAGVDAGTDENVDYGLYVERGTSKMRAQPYIVPALHQVTGGLK